MKFPYDKDSPWMDGPRGTADMGVGAGVWIALLILGVAITLGSALLGGPKLLTVVGIIGMALAFAAISDFTYRSPK